MNQPVLYRNIYNVRRTKSLVKYETKLIICEYFLRKERNETNYREEIIEYIKKPSRKQGF